MLSKVLEFYIIAPSASIQPFGTGLINHTWKVSGESEDYILQKINDTIFRQPLAIAENIESISSALNRRHPGYLFIAPVKTKEGKGLVYIEGEGYFRLFPFVKGSHTCDVTETPGQAFEAAKQFGLFTKMLADFPASTLNITLPDFHDLGLRYTQFEQALKSANSSRILEAAEVIDLIRVHEYIVSTYRDIKRNTDFKTRVTHHDTKISNILFDEEQKGLCVIDLDTVMPGYFISDVGDMMRTYLSPVSEEEKDFSKIMIREDYFQAIASGYLGEMGNNLTPAEIDHFVYAGLFMTYMQALRFLTDHLNNDSYYGAKYEGHNYIRAVNQLTLLQRMIEKEEWMKGVVNDFKC